MTPCLLLHQGGLVKTVRFSNPTYVGDPINAVRIFNEKEADELIVVDIDAAVEGREPNFRLIAQLAMECRMPLCYGGGVRTVDQARRIIASGVEKVSISSAFVERPALASEIAREIGNQSVVVTLDVKKKRWGGGYEVHTHNGKRATGRTPLDLAAQAEGAGAGELLINAIDQDGEMKGYDLALARAVRGATHIPLTFLGGAGSLADIAQLIGACGVVGAAVGSLFVFKGAYRAVLINYPSAQQKEAILREALGPASATAKTPAAV
ncbi:MAG TPA: AglZ/HisF2 family acetamidino modification protein [Polyangia bacterium]